MIWVISIPINFLKIKGMVLHRYDDSDFVECLYDSSNILGSKYIKKDKKLAIIFSSGRQYVYENVKIEDYKKFESAESQGKILHSVIKKYVGNQSKDIVNVLPLLEQIEEIKKNI